MKRSLVTCLAAACCNQCMVDFGSKIGKIRIEQMFSGLCLKANARQRPSRARNSPSISLEETWMALMATVRGTMIGVRS